MPFIADQSWTPATYRRAHEAWAAQAPANDSEIVPRKAETKKPRHRDLAPVLRPLLTWRALMSTSPWTAANDNDAPPPATDRLSEIRPRIDEIVNGLNGVDIEDRREARIGGGGQVLRVITGGDIERRPATGLKSKKTNRKSKKTNRKSKKTKPDVLARAGSLSFSDGAAEERATIIGAAGVARRGSVRIPLGGLVKVGKARPFERYGKPKGPANDNAAPTVGPSLTATASAVDFADPVADADEARHLRQALGDDAIALDAAVSAASFADVGKKLGYFGKTAERRGKAAVVKACARLAELLAA